MQTVKTKQVLVVGGTRGLGKAIADELSILWPVTATGSEIDLTTDSGLETLLKIAGNCDIVVNNAYAGRAQQQFLMLLYERYKNTNKIVVNVESVNAWREGKLTSAQIDYATNKLALVQARRYLQKHDDRKMKIIGVCPSIIDTEYNKEKQVPKLSPEDAARVIVSTIDLAQQGIEITEIHFQSKE